MARRSRVLPDGLPLAYEVCHASIMDRGIPDEAVLDKMRAVLDNDGGDPNGRRASTPASSSG